MSGALSLGATYSRPKGGRVPSPLGAHARPLSLLAAFFSHILMQRGLRFGALEALRGTSGGASMTTPGGSRTRLRIAFLKLTRARPTGFYHRVGAPRLQG